MIQDFLIPFIAVAIAELGDKTQLILFSLASRSKNHFQLLLGAVLGFIIADGLAVFLGDIISDVIPIKYVKIGASVIFVIFGIVTLIHREEEEEVEKNLKRNSFVSAFIFILIAEMGDKTQIVSALFGSNYNRYMVLLGVITALTILSVMAILLGKLLMSRIDGKKVSIIAGVLFIVIGIIYFVSSF